ncbi:hypothetical protein E9840_05850 [Tissierella creatinini]|nr:hypothetical protein E9840_05850 [Tissierella creatinini]TJX63974.1 hypothetical protein E8P77_13445 [Soehngenia saccharolytica]
MKNIEYLMDMTKSYLDGEMDTTSYWLDFPYQLEVRYKKALREDRELAELIYDCLFEDGINLYNGLTDDEFKAKIAQEYEYINGVLKGTDIL